MGRVQHLGPIPVEIVPFTVWKKRKRRSGREEIPAANRREGPPSEPYSRHSPVATVRTLSTLTARPHPPGSFFWVPHVLREFLRGVYI
jgi:hypothetical protein